MRVLFPLVELWEPSPGPIRIAFISVLEQRMGAAYSSEGFEDFICRKREAFVGENVLYETGDLENDRVVEFPSDSFI